MALGRATYVLATLGMVLGTSGHIGDEMAAHSPEPTTETAAEEAADTYPPTYFTLNTHQVEIRAHITLMILSWFILLPIATMLSLARSRYTHFARLGLAATNILGVLCAVAYKNNTPDLYPASAHSALGWITTGIAAAQISHVLVGPMTKLFNRVAGRDESTAGGYTLPPMRESYRSLQGHDDQSDLPRQRSFDVEATQVGMEEDCETSPDSRLYQEDPRESGSTSGDGTVYGDSDFGRTLHHDPSATVASKIFSRPILTRSRRLILLTYDVMDRIITIVAFIAFCTGIVTFWGLFKGNEIFNGIAHWIKGGIFFWLGIFNLGRWYGCFAEKGWAWNIRPDSLERQHWLSPEFVESALIFIYGSTNIFLEHLAGRGKPWSPRDLQHVSITVLFIGGGLCGLLVEYIRVKRLGEKKETQHLQTMPAWSNSMDNEQAQPKLSTISMNPMPALVVFLMGRSMASHEQGSMVSTMVHKQWGNLLGAASVARLLTYVIMHMKPPTSTSPSRPPTELLASFCHVSGGILFMASSRDTVEGMIHFGVDPMALYTVTMGLTGMLMAWTIALLALKSCASR